MLVMFLLMMHLMTFLKFAGFKIWLLLFTTSWFCWARQGTPLVPAFGRQRQADLHGQGCIVRSYLYKPRNFKENFIFTSVCACVCVSADEHMCCHTFGSWRVTFGSQLFSSTMTPGNLIQVVWLAQRMPVITDPSWGPVPIKKYLFLFYVLVYKGLCVCTCVTCVSGAYCKQKRTFGLLGQHLQLLWAPHPHVGAGSRTWALCKDTMNC